MRKLILIVSIGLFSVLSASQSQDKKDRLLSAVQMLGGSCGSVVSYTELKGYGGSNGSISIYCSNGANYSLKKDTYSSNGYKLVRR